MFGAEEWRRRGGFAPRVRELDAGTDSLGVDEVDDALQARDVVVFVDSQIVGSNASFRDDGGGFKHDQAGTALCAATEVNHVPVVCKAIVGRILAHG